MGKITELTGGILLTLGLFTRIGSLITAATMLYISLFVGNGRIWYEDQHPFLFVLLAMVFFFTGAGKWSLDKIIFEQDRNLKINNHK
jgi:putative oxidoreductase